VQFVVRTAGNYERLSQAMDDFVRRARQDPGLAGPWSVLSMSMSPVGVQIDRALAANLKVALCVISDKLAAISGERNFNRFFWPGELYHFALELEAPVRDSLSMLDEVSVRATDGKRLQLRAFILARETTGRYAPRHFKQLPAVQLIAGLAPGASLGRVIGAREQAAQATLPPECSGDFAGPSRQARQGDAWVGPMFLPTLAFIHLFLAAQSESFDGSVIVLITVPVAIVRSLLTLCVVPLAYSSISSRTRTTLPQSPARHPQAASSGGLFAVPGE
jgi:multidrug efflux pump